MSVCSLMDPRWNAASRSSRVIVTMPEGNRTCQSGSTASAAWGLIISLGSALVMRTPSVGHGDARLRATELRVVWSVVASATKVAGFSLLGARFSAKAICSSGRSCRKCDCSAASMRSMPDWGRPAIDIVPGAVVARRTVVAGQTPPLSNLAPSRFGPHPFDRRRASAKPPARFASCHSGQASWH